MAATSNDALWISGKTCMITGATSGLGRVTALELARMGASTVLVCRNRARGEELVREIAGVAKEPATLMVADLASQAQIRKVAADFLATNSPLHVLVNNAGVFNLSRETTADGIETVFAVNHLAYFMLTMLLLERIKQSAPARIVNVTSDLHTRATINFDDIGLEHSYGGMRSYAQSKLANILFTYELARRLEGTGVTVNCVHPGAVATNLARNNGALIGALSRVIGLFMKSADRGARTQVYAASSPEVANVTGKYFIDCRERQSSAESHDPAIARRLWEMSAKMSGLPG